MPLQDSIAIPGGYGQLIADWPLGDDRIFTGPVTGLPPNDPSCVLAFFTLKQNPNDSDSIAILQKRITTLLQPSGQITGVPAINLLIHVFSGDYESFVNASDQYYWDFRIVTTNGITVTIATGIVQFLQNATKSNAAGLPNTIPSGGSIPSFRGFINDNPNNIIGYNQVDVLGDLYLNGAPQPGAPSGWACIASGGPGKWVSMGITGNIVIFPAPTTPPLAAQRGGSGLPIIRGFISDNPNNIVGYNAIDIQGDLYFNQNPQPGAPSGWTCISSGQPGAWASMGITGND